MLAADTRSHTGKARHGGCTTCGSLPNRRTRHGSGSCAAHRQMHPAVVIENRMLCVDGSIRMVTLSVDDPVKMIEGRRMPLRPAQPRWLEAYHMPGQQVLVRMGGSELKAVIASSPSEMHQRSANLDACICEVAVSDADKAGELFEAEPGAQAEVSDIYGVGFASPSQPGLTLMKALEGKHPLLLVMGEAHGFGAAKAVLSWDPVLALATEQPIVAVIVTGHKLDACLGEVAAWEKQGVRAFHVYTDRPREDEQADEGELQQGSAPGHDAREEAAEGGAATALFTEADRLTLQLEQMLSKTGKVGAALGGKWQSTVALLAGLPADQAKAVLTQLSSHGIAQERILMP